MLGLALGIIGSLWAILARVWHYWLALGVIGSHWALLARVGHYWLALGVIGSHWALLARVGHYWLMLGAHFGHARVFRYQHVDIGNATPRIGGPYPTRRPNTSGFALQLKIDSTIGIPESANYRAKIELSEFV